MNTKVQSNTSNNDKQKSLSPTDKIICRICIVRKILSCPGHGGGSGSGSGTSSNNNETKSNSSENQPTSPLTFIESDSGHAQLGSSSTMNNMAAALDWKQQLTTVSIISLEQGLLNIQSDNLRGILIFQAIENVSPENLLLVNEALQMIKSEFDLFKKQLPEKDKKTIGHHFTATVENGSLTIRIPHPTYFSDFVQRLAQNNFLPSPTQNTNLEIQQQTINKKSPFIMQPKPKWFIQ